MPNLKIATFNINGIRSRLPALLTWLRDASPDVVCLQELKALDSAFPIAAINDAGYGAIRQGQSAWNGVAILAKGTDPIESRRGLPGDRADKQSRYTEAAVSGLLVGCLYLPNGNPQPGPKFDYKLARNAAYVGGGTASECRLTRRPERRAHRPCADGDARRPRAGLDRRRTGEYRGNVALDIFGALYRSSRRVAAAVSDPVETHDCCGSVAIRQGEGDGGGPARRLCVRRRVQSGFQDALRLRPKRSAADSVLDLTPADMHYDAALGEKIARPLRSLRPRLR